MRLDRRRFLLASAGTAIAATLPARAEVPGVEDGRVLFGQSCALEGPARALGRGMKAGLELAFAEVNAAGGVHGRRLELISYDDGYEPEKAIANTRRLIERDRVFALVGEVGTPTSKAAMPLAVAAGVPFLAPFTGAQLLREPFRREVVNVRASYFQETEALVDHFVRGKGYTRIAVFYQDDSYGRAGREGVRRALERRGMAVVGEGTYERNTLRVKRGLVAIRRSRPQAVIMIGAYAPCAEFIRLARRIGLGAEFANVSFVGTRALAEALGGAGKGVIVSQVVPFPEDTSVPLVAAYHRALARSGGGEPGFVSLEGYMAGRLVVEALRRAGRGLDRDRFLDAIYGGGPFDLGGVTLTYGPADNQGMDLVFLTELDGRGGVRPLARMAG